MDTGTTKDPGKKKLLTNLILITIVILFAIVPLYLSKGAEFAGADEEAEAAIMELNPDYQPWFTSIWEPPSGEIETLLFSLQAALGAGVVGFGIGYLKGKSQK